KKGELYLQIEVTKDIWKTLDEIANRLYDENWMIDDHYRGEIKDNDYFSFNKDGINLCIIMTKNRAHIIILESANLQKEIKKFIFKDYSFHAVLHDS
ncbi:MAG: hypothetical protein AABY00_01420, partial [Nanoarchaeota archaeon]